MFKIQQKMANVDSSWNGLDGSGIVVTVGDTGLDNGINNTNMHPDFKDHIKGILSLPIPSSKCSWNGGGGTPGTCDDGATDYNGHGTHVAGSVLGDGTDSSGAHAGIAPEAQLLFHAIGQKQWSKPRRDTERRWGYVRLSSGKWKSNPYKFMGLLRREFARCNALIGESIPHVRCKSILLQGPMTNL